MSTTTKSAITLRPAPHRKAICECEMPYGVLLHGQVFGALYFNLRGYQGYLPTPDGKKLDIGEKTLAAYKREIAVLNRAFKVDMPMKVMSRAVEASRAAWGVTGRPWVSSVFRRSDV